MLHSLPDSSGSEKLSPKLIADDKSRQLDSELLLRKTFEEDARQGLALLFRKYYAPLCSHAVRFVYSRQIAEDLVSEVFFQFYKTEAYRHITTSYTSYLFRSVRNEAFNYLRREFARNTPLDSSFDNQQDTVQLSPDAEIQYNHLFLKVNQTIAELPTQCQRVFLMSRFDDKKYKEIADELRISPKTVEVHISKALKHLRDALRGEWITLLMLAFIH